MAKKYKSPSIEPLGGSSEVVPMVTLAGLVYAVGAGVVALVGAGVGAGAGAVYGVVVSPCKPYW